MTSAKKCFAENKFSSNVFKQGVKKRAHNEG